MTGAWEWIIIVGVIVLIFGASAIPKLARSVGQAKSEFEKGVKIGKDAAKNPEDVEKK